MSLGFIEIPDWLPFENQGAGLAVADLDGTGRIDLVVLMVDNPPGQNQGFYRVGKDLDTNGNVTGTWGPWIAIPDWFPFENQGAGVAVAALEQGQRPDLIVFMIDNPPGRNQGYYRVGSRLDADGNVTGGWGPWIPIPDWFFFENQYGGIAVADLDNDGRPELIVLMVDNPEGQNRGVYRIGRRLDGDGNVTGGWSDWRDVPEWFSFENQGAGVAIADVNNSGLLDLIVFQIDNLPNQNQAFYKIGRNLDTDGNVSGGWGNWLGVPAWFSQENQGGGVVAADINRNGRHELIVLMVDNPPGQNAGLYRVLELGADPVVLGQWELLPYDSEVLPVHAAVLPTGRVLFFAGSGNNPTRFNSPDFGNVSRGIFTSVVWDPAGAPTPGTDGNFFHPDTIFADNGRPFDFFCGGDSFLGDGRLLSAGGTLEYDIAGTPTSPGRPFLGRADATVFDPSTQQWAHVARMAHGRWYPTLVTLGDGRVLAASGLDDVTGSHNAVLEIYSPDRNEWQSLNSPPEFNNPDTPLPLYAHLFLMADGRLFYSGGRQDDTSRLGPRFIDITKDPVQTTEVPGLEAPESRNQSASVLLPPAQDQRVMIIGGGPEDESDATDRVDIVDCKAAQPEFRAATPINLPRMHVNAVLLPDHTVFVSGGSLRRENQIVARFQSEIYDPATDTWRITATAVVSRRYHSIALLLPDGRVVAGGGNPARGTQVNWEPPDPNEELRLERYSPPYLFKGPRPVIDDVPIEWQYGQTVTIRSAQAGTIRWASLIKNGVTTHFFDTGQRLVDLDITSQADGAIQAVVTNNPNIAPRGWYMLFIVTHQGVPSVARWIHLT